MPKKTSPKKEKKRRENLRRALLGGARAVEKSISKIAWDAGQGKIKVSAQRLDYQVHWVLNCAADLITQEYWLLPAAFDGVITINNPRVIVKKAEKYWWNDMSNSSRGSYDVVIDYRTFRKFLGRNDISTDKALEIFLKVPEVILTAEAGTAKIPYYFNDGRWGDIRLYKDNICGLSIASEDPTFSQYRSTRRLRSRGAGREEPVFILTFTNAYGRAFVQNAMHRETCQLQDHALYRLRPEAQTLYQAVRWRSQNIRLNTEQISKIIGWVWPPKNYHDRVVQIRRTLKILHEAGYITKWRELGKTLKRKAWFFNVRRGKLLKTQQPSY